MGYKRTIVLSEFSRHRVGIHVVCPRCGHQRTYQAMGLALCFELRTNAVVAELRFACSRCTKRGVKPVIRPLR